MQIDLRRFGDLVVVDLQGKMTLGEGDELLKDTINALLDANESRIALNLGGVPYIDSAGLGELVRTYTSVSRRGGRLVLCGLAKRIEDLLIIEKLLCIFQVYRTVDQAAADFGATPFEVTCPVCGPRQWLRVRGPLEPSAIKHDWGWERSAAQTCASCLASFVLRATLSELTQATESGGQTAQVPLFSVRLPTYQGESIMLVLRSGAPAEIVIDGRLDLFASDMLERAWHLVPVPRRIVFTFGSCRELTGPGFKKLTALCEQATDVESASVILAPWVSSQVKDMLAGYSSVVESGSAARQTLKRGGFATPLLVVCLRAVSDNGARPSETV